MSDYDKDFVFWAQKQARLLHEHRTDELDLPNLAEEVEAMARHLEYELVDRMADVVRLEGLLRTLPGDPWAASWPEAIRRQRNLTRLILRDAPSLKSRLPALFEDAIETGRLRAVEALAGAFPGRRFDDVFASMPPLKIEDLI